MSKSKTSPFLLVILSMLYLPTAWAQQEVIVEASPINDEKIEPSRSTTIITEQEIKIKKSNSVADILRSIPGVEVVRQGGLGQTTSVFIRGARAEDTLVLIDGTESNDAMSPACGFDFSTLSPDGVLRIEVYRGPQSVRFGAGALGGVINIVTKEGSAKRQTNYLFEAGSYQTARVALGSSGKLGDLGYAVGLDHLGTKGFSAASDSSGNSEADGSKVHTASTKLSWAPNTRAKIEGTFRFSKSDTDIDLRGGADGDDPNDTTTAKQSVAGLLGSSRFFDERLKSNLGFYFSEVDRDGRNLPDAANTTDSSDHFLSENRKVKSDHELSLGEEHSLRVGLQWRDESGISNASLNGTTTDISRRSQSTMGESITYPFESTTWFFDLGGRADQSSTVGNIPSYRASLGRQYLEGQGKAYVSYGTGFKLPSLYQLYSKYGDANLNEEQSSTAEVTVEQKLGQFAEGSLTVFENQFQDLIDFNMATSKYFNVSRAQSRGVEVQSSVALSSLFNVKGSYTFLDSIDKSTGLDLIRRPKNAWNIGAQYRASAWKGSVEFRFRGERDDVDPITFARVKNSSYGIFNVSVGYKLCEWLKFNGRIENLLDKNYEEVAGYGTAGVSFFAGISGEF